MPSWRAQARDVSTISVPSSVAIRGGKTSCWVFLGLGDHFLFEGTLQKPNLAMEPDSYTAEHHIQVVDFLQSFCRSLGGSPVDDSPGGKRRFVRVCPMCLSSNGVTTSFCLAFRWSRCVMTHFWLGPPSAMPWQLLGLVVIFLFRNRTVIRGPTPHHL